MNFKFFITRIKRNKGMLLALSSKLYYYLNIKYCMMVEFFYQKKKNKMSEYYHWWIAILCSDSQLCLFLKEWLMFNISNLMSTHITYHSLEFWIYDLLLKFKFHKIRTSSLYVYESKQSHINFLTYQIQIVNLKPPKHTI